MTAILVVNAGSSSIKVTLFDGNFQRLLSGMASEIGGASVLAIGGEGRAVAMRDHADAFRHILAALEDRGIAPGSLTAAGHRVVHGGRTLLEPRRLTADVIAEIAACVPLAPLHNPHNLTAIRALAEAAPDLAQYASFDTAFHATNPDMAQRYALPAGEDAKGIRRYGFHGISYTGLSARCRRSPAHLCRSACSHCISATVQASAPSATGNRLPRPWAIRRSTG